MPAAAPISIDWPGRHAVLFVHGVGNAMPGEYASLVASVRALLGDAHQDVAMYELYYDIYNDWLTAKMPLSSGITSLLSSMKEELGTDELGAAAAEFAGDIVWPVLNLAGRAIVREAYLAQLKQIVRDGIRAGVHPWNQKISIICHSLGCFHTYEALHAAANEPQHALRPLSNGTTFQNVVFMASPVQLIRQTCSRIGVAVPNPEDLATLRGDSLSIPGQSSVSGYFEPSVKHWVSISGELDPVCGYLFRRKVDRCFMTMDGQETIIDDQRLLDIPSKVELATRIRDARRDDGPPSIPVRNPHSWQGYIDRHTDKLRQWLTA